jgi:molybdopterin-guanine dinucleotide biosynthesis protein MobB
MSAEALQAGVPLLGFAAYSGTGKTTLLEQLLPLLNARGLRVGMIKHAHHSFDIDQPGKDSYRLRKAGASQMLIASRERWALMTETPGQDEPGLPALLDQLDQSRLDLILVEGFKHERFPKIELNRAGHERPFMHPEDDSIIAIASDRPLDAPLPQLDINDPEAIVIFILEYVKGPTP